MPLRRKLNSGRTPGPGGLPPRQRRIIVRPASSGIDPQTLRYLIFFLIFVVGNAILFLSTGSIIIPR